MPALPCNYRAVSGIERLIDGLRGDPAYVKFLLIERPYIRSALMPRSPFLSSEDRVDAYPTTIGNPLHNDIIELEMWLNSLSPQDRSLLLSWASREDRAPSFGWASIRRVNALLAQRARSDK